MERLITRKEAAQMLGVSLSTLDTARTKGQISYVQYTPNGSVYFTTEGLHEYVAKCTHRAKPQNGQQITYRRPRTIKQ